MLQLTQVHTQWLLLGGRILLGLLFLVAGIQKVMGGIDGLSKIIDTVTSLPFPALIAVLVIAVEVAGGAFIILGYFTRYASIALVVFVLGTIVFFHPGWSDMGELMPMLKNLSIIGGLLAFIASGPGVWSLDATCRNMRTQTTSAHSA